MKQMVFMLVTSCILAGCATEVELSGSADKAGSGRGLPVRIGVQREGGLPVEVQIGKDGKIPVSVEPQNVRGLPVEVKLPGVVLALAAVIGGIILVIAVVACMAARSAARSAEAACRLAGGNKRARARVRRS